MRGKVISIATDDHFADYAEPANIVPVLKGNSDDYNRYVRLGLIVLGCCALAAVAFVKWEFNY
jgi:hypothetical protein